MKLADGSLRGEHPRPSGERGELPHCRSWHHVGPAAEPPAGGRSARSRSRARVCIGRTAAAGSPSTTPAPRGVLPLGRRAQRGRHRLPCHGSEFDVRTGDVLTPPALDPLPSTRPGSRGRARRSGSPRRRLAAEARPRSARTTSRRRSPARRPCRARRSTASSSTTSISPTSTWEERVPYDWLALLRRNAPLHLAGGARRPRASGRSRATTTSSQVSKDWETYSSEPGGTSLEDLTPEELEARKSMLDTDPPPHTRLRALVNKGFTRAWSTRYEERIRGLAREHPRRGVRAATSSTGSSRSPRRSRCGSSPRSWAFPSRTGS